MIRTMKKPGGYLASNLLKEYIDTNFSNNNVIVLGDLNDILIDECEN
jgi:hypothetical protein